MTDQQERALALLRAERGRLFSPRTVAEALGTSPEGAAVTCSSLVKKGLAERVRRGRIFYRASSVPDDEGSGGVW